MKNKIISLFIRREHLILLSKLQLNDQSEIIMSIDQYNQKNENVILKTERWPQQDLDYFQNTFVQIVNLTFSYFRMNFPINSALLIRDHLKFVSCLKQINFGGVTLEEVFKQQRLRLSISISYRLQEEQQPPKILYSKLDFIYIGILQSKYFNSRDPEFQIPYVVLNLKPIELKLNTKPNREISISQFSDVPTFSLLNAQLIQPIINYDNFQNTYEYKLSKLIQRNSFIQQTIKKYYQSVQLFEQNFDEKDPLKQLFNLQIQNSKEQKEDDLFSKLSRKQKFIASIGQIQLPIDKVTNNTKSILINSLNSNDTDRNKSLLQTIQKFSKNESFTDNEKRKTLDRQQKLKNRIKNLNSMIHQQVEISKKQDVIQEQQEIETKNDNNSNNSQIGHMSMQIQCKKRKSEENLRSLTQYTIEDSYKYDRSSDPQSNSKLDKIILPNKQQKYEERKKMLIDQLSNSIEINGQKRNYQFRRSQYAPENRKQEDGSNSNNTEHIRQQPSYSIKKQGNKSLEKLTLKPIDYASICSGKKKIQCSDMIQIPKKQKRYQTQERDKEGFAINEILKLKKQSNQNVRNALLLLTSTRSEELLTSLIASGSIKHQQYQSFLQPIKVNSTAKYLTPK